MKPEQQSVPLVYSFTIAQGFSVVKAFRLLFFRKIAEFLDFFRPPSRHTLGFYPRITYLHYFFNKILIPQALHENRFFIKKQPLSFHCTFPVFPQVAKADPPRRNRLFIGLSSFFIYYFVDLIVFAQSQIFSLFPFTFCLLGTIIRDEQKKNLKELEDDKHD